MAMVNGQRENGLSMKRAASDDAIGDDVSKKLKTMENADIDVASVIRKQIEYYFSDDNLRTDRFFQPKIASATEGWLEMKFITSCRKIQSLKVSEKDIIAALSSSSLETKVDSNNVAWVRRTTPPPDLEVTKKKQAGNKRITKKSGEKAKDRKGLPKDVSEIHTLGYLLKVSSIPEEVSWSKVKEALNTALALEENVIRQVTAVSSSGESFAYFRRFPNDTAILEKITSLDLNGTTSKVELVNDIETAEKGLLSLPHNILKDRLSQFMKLKTIKEEKLRRPLTLGGEVFEHVDHLRSCYRELLDLTSPGTALPPTAYKVIRALLDYHPNAVEKGKDVVEIKVELWKSQQTESPNKAAATKCFVLVRSDGTTEDFSVVKCIDRMMKDPPYARTAEEENCGVTTAVSRSEVVTDSAELPANNVEE